MTELIQILEMAVKKRGAEKVLTCGDFLNLAKDVSKNLSKEKLQIEEDKVRFYRKMGLGRAK